MSLSTPPRASLPKVVGVYERPRSVWLRAHLAEVIGVVLSVLAIAAWALRRWG